MNNLKRHYEGAPFVGIQTTTLDRVPDDIGMRTYCLLRPPSETELGGMRGIPFDPDPEHPWIRGIKGLAATVVQVYGLNYRNHVTFEPPQSQKVGSDEHGWCTMKYESLPRNELEEFQKAADLWIQNRLE